MEGEEERVKNKFISNEREICEAIAKLFENRFGCQRHHACFPEEEKAGAPVDYVFWLRARKFAIEHTLVEPFEDYTRMAVQSDPFISNLREMLKHKFPAPGIYYLDLSIDPTANLKQAEHLDALNGIVSWATLHAQAMHSKIPTLQDVVNTFAGREQREESVVSGIRVVLLRQLHRSFDGRFDGAVFIGRIAPFGYESQRRIRLERAIVKKHKQLQPYRESGATTVLVLENRDLFLSNHCIVGNAAAEIVSAQNLKLDELLYCDAVNDKFLTLVSVIRNGEIWPDEETDKRFYEFARQISGVVN